MSNMPEPPKIKVTAGDIEISYVVTPLQWNGSVYEYVNNFMLHMEKTALIELPYINLGETISIEFDGKAPDSAVLTDHILNADGAEKYNITPETVDIKWNKDKCSFVLDRNWATSLSSNSADYEPGATIRGFRLICKWGENKCEYTFIIRSDAAITMMPEEPGVIMDIQYADPVGLSFTFKNTTDKEYTYGEAYALYFYKDDSWVAVEPIIDNGAFNSIGYTLMPQSKTDEINAYWRWLYGELPEGVYKFQKEILFVRSPGDFDAYVVEQEFKLSSNLYP